MSYSIKPILRVDKAAKENGKHAIYFRIHLNKTLIKIPSGKEVEEKHWDKKTSKIKGGSLKQLLNTYLAKKVGEFNEFMLTQENLGKEVTRGIIKDFFKKKSKQTFYQFWEEQMKQWNKVKRESTMEGYMYTLQILKEFDPDLNWDSLTLDRIEMFDNYLRSVRNNSDGGVFGRHKCLKVMIKIAIRKELMAKNPYADFKIRSADGHRMFLELDEVKRVMALRFDEEEQKLQRVCEMFQFGCFTGLRFSDVSQLNWANLDLKKRTLEMDMQKTGKLIRIPLIEPALKILFQRRSKSSNPNDLVFDPVSNQHVNRVLKELMTRAKIKKQITFHCARHSFACNHIESNTHMLVLKDLLGHSNVAQTEIYAKTLNSQMIGAMKQLEDRYRNDQGYQPTMIAV